MFNWLRRKTRQLSLPSPEVPVGLPLSPMGQYTQEFMAASERSGRLGVRLSPVQLLVEKDCLSAAILVPILREFMLQYSEDEVPGQALPINTRLLSFLLEKTGVPFTFTMGWLEHGQQRLYQHGEELIEKLLREGIAACPSGLPLHAWLTSPAMEIVDLTLLTMIAHITENRDLSGHIIYYSNQQLAPEYVFHPTVVGEDFLLKIGAAVTVGL